MNEVVAAVRSKYPGVYDDLSDDQLTLAIGKRFGSAYDDVGDFKEDFYRISHPTLQPTVPAPGQRVLGKTTDLGVVGRQMIPSQEQQVQEMLATPEQQALTKKLTTPALDLPIETYAAPAAALLPESMQQGLAEKSKEVIEGMTSPEGLATLPYMVVGGAEAAALKAGTIGGRAVAGAFGAVGVEGTIQSSKDFVDAVQNGDVKEATKAAAGAAVNALMAYGGAKSVGGLKDAVSPPVIPETLKAMQDAALRVDLTRVPPERQLPAPSIKLNEFTETTVAPDQPKSTAGLLPAPGETGATAGLLPESPLAPRTEGYRISLPIEPETAKAARRVWSKPIDIEAQVVGVDALKQLVSLTDEAKTPGKPYQPPTVNVDLRQLEKVMQRNSVSKTESWADEVIQDRLKNASSNPFLDPELLAAAVVKGAILFKRGVTELNQWNDEMRKQFGRGMEENLPVIYRQAADYWKSKEPTNASKISQAAEVHGNVRPLQETPQGLPIAQGGAGIQPETQGRVSVENKPAQVTSEQAPRSEVPAEPMASAAVKPGVAAPGTAPAISEPTPTVSKTQTTAGTEVSTQAEAGASTTSGKVEPAGGSLFSPEALQTVPEKTVGLVPSRSSPLSAGRVLKEVFQKWFTPEGDLPKEVYGLSQTLEAAKTASDFDIRMRERDLMGALKEVYGLTELEVAGGGSRRIPPAAVQLMDEYLHGRVANPAAIPPQVRGVLDTMRAEINAGSNQVIDTLMRRLGRMRPGTQQHENLLQLIDKIRSNMDIYVNRSYKFFDSNKKVPDWYAELNPAVRLRAENYLIQNSPTPMTQPEAQAAIGRWLNDLKEGQGYGSSKLGSKDLSIFNKRTLSSQELRDVLGEYHNPLINYAKSVSKMADFVAKQRFLDEVKRIGMGRFLFEEGMEPPGFSAKIAGEGSDTMSPLNGLRTTEEIAQAFKDFHKANDYGAIARAYFTLNAWSKFAATGLSWMTQARNLASRPLMAAMAGHYDVRQLGKSVRAIYEDFAGSDTTWRQYLKDAYEHGVIGDTARSGELRAIVKDAALQDVGPAEIHSWSFGRALKKYGYKIPAEIYRLSDELGNLFGWENEKALQRQIHPTWTESEIKARAADIVRKIYPTYSNTPAAVKAFRKVAIVGPFVTFPYQMLRTAWNAFGLSISEIRSVNPVERAIGYKRLAGQTAAVAGTWGLQELGKALWNVSRQEEDDFRRFQPDWSKNSKFMFVGKDKGILSAINLSYLDPYSYMTDPLVAVMSSIKSGRSPIETMIETGKEFFRPWISEQMLAKALIEARNGKTDSGRDIYNPTDSSIEKWEKMGMHVLKSLEPGTLQRFQRRILPAIRNEQPIYGRKLEVGPEIARELSGLAVEQFDFRNGLAYRAKQFTEKDRASEGVFHQVVSRTETTTPTDLLNAYKDSDKRRYEIWKEMRQDFLAAVRQGVKVQEAKKLMRARGMTDRDARDISNGRYEPMPISDGTKKRLKERNRELPMQQVREYQREAKKFSLD